MATQHATAVSELLGKTIVLTETISGFQFERRGRVIGVVQGLPGSRCGDEFLLDQDDGDCQYYTPGEVTICAVL
jgi:hypothetical protein